MLHILTFQTYNWGYAPFMHPLPVGVLTLCYGDNGSGKTTYLTGIGLLLGVSRLPKGKSYDHYVREGENWAFLKVVADNSPDATGKRPFDLLLPNPLHYDTCTLACLLVNRQGEWKRTYYIVPGEAFEPTPQGRDDPAFTFTQEKYRAALEYVGVRSATMRLLELGVTGMHDLYEPRRLFNFFLDLIGSETIRSSYTQARREWRRAQEILETTQGRYMRQASEVENIGKAIESQRQRRLLDQTRVRYNKFIEHARLRTLKASCEEKMKSYHHFALQKAQTEQEIQALGMRLAGLHAEYTEFTQQRQQWEQKREQAETQWEQQNMQVVRSIERSHLYLETITALKRPPLYYADELVLALERQEEEEARQRQQVLTFEKQQRDLEKEIQELNQGRSSIPTEVKTFLQTLREQNIPFYLVADAVHILDTRWIKAVEGILGIERFTIVIHDPHLLVQAKRIAERTRYRYWISPPRVAKRQIIPPDSLWSTVRVTNENVAGWVEEHLFSVYRVDTVEQGDVRSNSERITTITPDAYRQEARGGRSVYPYQMVCGHTARQARMQEITEEMELQVTPRQEALQHLEDLQHRTHTLREHLQRAREQQELPAKERDYAEMLVMNERAQEEEGQLHAVRTRYKKEEKEWADQDKAHALLEQQLTLDQGRQLILLQKTNDDISGLRLENLQKEIERLEGTVSPLSEEMQTVFEQEQFGEGEYHQRIQDIEQKLERLPKTEEIYEEGLYKQQQANVKILEMELTQARERVVEHHDLFEKAVQDYSQHIDDLFSRGMASEFRKLCPLAHAQGNLIVQKSDDINDWSLEVRIGFDGKNRMSLSDAPLSRGQEVLTSLYLVLAALRTVHATPILLLDELVALLDENNAPKVLAGLKETGVQAFVATPQNRLGANEQADVLWGFSRKDASQSEAPAIAVIVRHPSHLSAEPGEP